MFCPDAFSSSAVRWTSNPENPPGVCVRETPLACPDWGTPVVFRSQKFVKGKVPLGRDPALGAITPRIALSSKLNPGIRFPFVKASACPLRTMC